MVPGGMVKRFSLAAVFFLLSSSSSGVFAIDGIDIDLAGGDESSTVVGASVKWNWDKQWFSNGDWYVGGYWELGAGHWDGDSGEHRNSSITHAGITPVFRLARHKRLANGAMPFIEGAIGFHLMSDDKIGDKDLGGAFTFKDHLSAGVQFGTNLEHELSLRAQHFSNADLHNSNPGFNTIGLRYGHNF